MIFCNFSTWDLRFFGAAGSLRCYWVGNFRLLLELEKASVPGNRSLNIFLFAYRGDSVCLFCSLLLPALLPLQLLYCAERQ